MNEGRFDGGKLDESQKALREKYREIISLSHHEVVANGAFYDLMYANKDNPDFNTKKVYAFIRYTNKERALFVANYSDHDLEVKVKIPEHALELMYQKKEHEIEVQYHETERKQFPTEVVKNDGIPVKVFRNNYRVLELVF